MLLGNFDAARIAAEKSIRLCEVAGIERLRFVSACALTDLSLEMHNIDAAISEGRALAFRLRNTPHSDLLGVALGNLASTLVAHGDLDEALITAREAVPLLRSQGMLYWLFDHLALRAGLIGRITDAARIAGYADSLYQAAGSSREPIGIHVTEHLSNLIGAALSCDEIVQLQKEGALLSEEQAVTLALRN